MNNTMHYKGYFGTVEYSDEDKILFGKIIGIRSLVSYEGNSIKSLQQNFQAAVDDYLQTCAEDGLEPEKTYKGTFNVRISPDLHRKLTIYSALHKKTLNATVENAIEQLIAKEN